MNLFQRIAALTAALTVLAAISTANTIVVTQSGFGFSPPNITINVGDTVMWQWTNFSHTVSEGTDGIVNGNEAFTSNLNAMTPTFSFTFTAAFCAANPRPNGLYNYFCAVHFPVMVGTIKLNANGTSFCEGDTSSSLGCPCANTGAIGHGCENSASTGGSLLVANGASTPSDALVLTASGELATALSIFLQGDLVVSETPFGDGLRCVGGNLKRIGVKSAAAGQAFYPGAGDPSISARSATLGDPITPGTSRYYQVYYRDASPTFCPAPTGSTFNISNGTIINW